MVVAIFVELVLKNKYFQIKKNDTGYHLAHMQLCALAYIHHTGLKHVHALQASKLVL
jgi:hypothetical protein